LYFHLSWTIMRITFWH